MSVINIREYKKEDYLEASLIANELHSTIFGPLLGFSEEECLPIIREYAFPNREDGALYVLTEDEKIMGLINFKYKELKKHKDDFSFKAMRKQYGFYKTLVFSIAALVMEEKVEKNELYVDYLVVSKEGRSKGYGTKLLDFGFEKASEHKKSKYTLNVLSSNPLAQKLYERNGFMVTKTTKLPRFARKRMNCKSVHRMVKLVL